MKRPLSNSAADFAPIALVAQIPIAIVTHSSLSVASLGELVALARAQPGSLSYGSSALVVRIIWQWKCSSRSRSSISSTCCIEAVIRSSMILSVAIPRSASSACRQPRNGACVSDGRRKALRNATPCSNDRRTGLSWFRRQILDGAVSAGQTPDSVIAKLAQAVGTVLDDPEVAANMRKQGAEPLRES